MRSEISILMAALALSGVARATECGEARVAVQHLRTAATVEEGLHHAAQAFEARANLKAAEKKLQSACAPRRVTVSALPLGYVSVPPGNLSRATFEPGELWRPQLTTLAGAVNGIVFAEPAALELPRGLRWETEPSANPTAGELLVAVAIDAALTVEEPTAGRGSWRIEVKAKPLMVTMSKLRACAAGKADATLKLAASACQSLLAVDPTPRPEALPARGRAQYLGEWQYGWHAAFELGAEELELVPDAQAPARLDLVLELSAPIPGVSDGKRLAVTLEANRQERPTGAGFKLGNGGCGDDDEACEKARFAVEVWYDRAFGVPFLRMPSPSAAQGKLTGKVTDRLARAIVGQRVLFTSAGRRVITLTDDHGDFRYDALAAGEATIVPVGKSPSNIPKGDEARTAKVGLAELKVPVIFINKLWE